MKIVISKTATPAEIALLRYIVDRFNADRSGAEQTVNDAFHAYIHKDKGFAVNPSLYSIGNVPHLVLDIEA